jgi:thiamine pyrophosphate-dependent acetolactate synthase large subunit-like protein
MGMINAGDALLLQLKADGLDVVFGNPGSTEEGFLEAVGRNPGIRYVLGLQEASVAAMADGWARTNRRAAICQVHAAVGLGNAMGVLYEAGRSHTPMVLLAGEAPQELQSFDGFLSADLVRIASPLAKWSARATHASQIPGLLRRAVKVAETPPFGPVFLALPMDVLQGEVDEARILPGGRVLPPGPCSDETAREIAGLLARSRAPLLLVGDGVVEADACRELQALAERLGAPVWGVECNEPCMPFGHPLFMGLIGHSFGENTRSTTLQADVVLALGTPLFPELFPSSLPYFAEDCALVQIDRDPWEIGKNFVPRIGLQADPKGSLASVLRELEHLGAPAEDLAETRRRQVFERKRSAEATLAGKLMSVSDSDERMSPWTMMRTLAASIPKDCLVYDESLTSTAALLHHLRPEPGGTYMLARGGCIGVGWPGAVGMALARPDRRVVAPSGDGSALFALQTLWTAVRYNLKVVFVVCNNGAYRILKINLLHYLKDTGGTPGPFPAMDIDHPRMDFAKLAAGFGMEAATARTASELRQALAKALEADGPFLVDALIDGSVDQEIHDLFPTSNDL